MTGPSTTRSSGQPSARSARLQAGRRRLGRRPAAPWRWQRLLSAALACGLGAACTLAVDDYEPVLVERGALEPPPSERSCDAGLECCGALPCADGGVCLSGACAAAAVPSAPADAGVCSGADCAAPPPVVLAPSCEDGAKNGDEVDVDCGGSCEQRCLANQACDTSTDCGPGFYCPDADRVCTAVSCSDGVQNGSELAQDCGGGCPGCPDGTACSAGVDCLSRVCEDASCAAASCEDGVTNQDEPAPDCGGSCPAECAPGLGCVEGEDCSSGVCAAGGCEDGVALCCQVPACDDGVLNGGEAALDCGGGSCAPCLDGSPCADDADCASTLCAGGRCEALPTCDDDEQNADETDVDCGGGTCAPCLDGDDCIEAVDCASNACEDGECVSCGDGEQNGLETDVDCGGPDPSCAGCPVGGRCNSNDDCAGLFCVAGICA